MSSTRCDGCGVIWHRHLSTSETCMKLKLARRHIAKLKKELCKLKEETSKENTAKQEPDIYD